MSKSNQAEQSVYAAAQGREFLKNALEGKENSLIFEYAGLIDDPEVLDFLNYYAGVFEDYNADFLETRVAEIVMQNAATHTADRAFREGNVSQLQGMVGLTNQDKDGKDLFSTAAEKLSYEGAIGLVFGAPGSGKTATTLDAALAWQIRTGGVLIGNTDWEGFERVVTSDEEMLTAMAEIEGPVLAVLDEIAQDLSGFGEGNKDAESFSDSLLFVRKREKKYGKHPKRGSVLMVGHTRTKTAKSIRRVASFGIEKPSRSDPGRARLLESEGGKDSWEETAEFKGVTDTAANYDEHEPSEFNILESTDDESDDGLSTEDIQRRNAIATVVLACKPWQNENGMGYREAASLVDYGKSWVGDRVRDWESGQYRDIVDSNGERIT